MNERLTKFISGQTYLLNTCNCTQQSALLCQLFLCLYGRYEHARFQIQKHAHSNFQILFSHSHIRQRTFAKGSRVTRGCGEPTTDH
jgi:hypothetical protein